MGFLAGNNPFLKRKTAMCYSLFLARCIFHEMKTLPPPARSGTPLDEAPLRAASRVGRRVGKFVGRLGSKAMRKKSFVSYGEAKRLVQAAGIETCLAFRKWVKSDGMPSHPARFYKGKGWISWGAFTGTGNKRGSPSRNWMSYEEAVRMVRGAGIKGKRAFMVWKRPDGMPSNPDSTYRNKGWTSWGAFLGTGRRTRTTWKTRVPYEEAVRLAREAGIRSAEAFRAWDRPWGVPCGPHIAYVGQGWVSWGEFFGTGRKRMRAKGRLPYEDASRLTQAAGIRTNREFENWKARPAGIPAKPALTYNALGVWKDWGHFLGTQRKRWESKTFVSYEEAVNLVRAAGIPSSTAYHKWKRPEGMPSTPGQVYKGKGWVSWPVFCGTLDRSVFVPYAEAEKLVRAAGITNSVAYPAWTRPAGMPSEPDKTYKGKGWVSWPTFCGPCWINRNSKTFVSYEDAVNLARAAGISTSAAFNKWKRPEGMPSTPGRVYKGKGWVSWPVFCGNESGAPPAVLNSETRPQVDRS